MNSSVTKKCFKSQRPKLLRSFFRLYFCCLLDKDLKGQCRQKNWVVLRWFLPYFKEKENCVIFFLFRLWSTPDLPHREIQLSLDCHQLSIRRRGNLSLKRKINKRVTDIDVVNEYRNLFLPLLSVYASVFNEAGVPFWKLHISVKLRFQLLAWWKKLSFVRRP